MPAAREPISKHDIGFPSAGGECCASLFLPEGTGRPPIVVLGHGIGGSHEDGLEPFARRFAEAGIAALAFTYRHFGGSSGPPRQLLDIESQLTDWAAAVSYVRSLPAVDTDRVALWGTSFGGGHVIEVAARDEKITAVVSQNPFTDGLAAVRAANPKSLARSAIPAMRDEIARLRKTNPVEIAIVGPPGSTAVMTSPDSDDGYRALIPAGHPFHNGIAARFMNRVPLYRPGRSAKKVSAPILFCICDQDAVAPARAAARWAATAPRGEIRRYPVGHFDIYRGQAFEQAVRDQTAFLARHLRVPESSAPQAPPATLPVPD
nr:alpha/beta fold hydrolase [Rhodococcus sp. (in: high G+C Gram-positive bacteria)]